ncbi:unnamed protein product [Closterium sp. NIES-53]
MMVTFFMNGKTLRQLASEDGFYSTFSYCETGVKDETVDKRMKRMKNVMLTVEKYRADESEEAIQAAIALIQKKIVDWSSISALADGVILGEEPPAKRPRTDTEDTETPKKNTTDAKRHKIGYLFFAAKMENDAWGTKMFGDAWTNIKIVEPQKLAKLKK